MSSAGYKIREAQGSIAKIKDQNGNFYHFLFRTGDRYTTFHTETIVPLKEGQRIHFFYTLTGENTGRIVEWVPDMGAEPKKEEVYAYLLSGRIRWMTKEIADALLKEFGDGIYYILSAHESALEGLDFLDKEQAAYLTQLFKVHKEADRQYISMKRKSHNLTWDSFYAMYTACGYNSAVMARELTKDPYKLAVRAGIPFVKADKFLIGLGALRTGINRTEGALIHAFHEEDGAFFQRLCAPENLLIKAIAETTGMTENASAGNMDALIQSFIVKEETLDYEPYIYYPYASYNIEKSIQKNLERIASKNGKDKGAAKLLKTIFGKTLKEPMSFTEELLKTVTQNSITLVDTDMFGMAAVFIAMQSYCTCALINKTTLILPGNPKEDAWFANEHKADAYLGELMQDTFDRINNGGKPDYGELDIESLMEKKNTELSTEEAIKDVIPVDWDEEVKDGKESVTVQCPEEERKHVYIIAFSHLMNLIQWNQGLEEIPDGAKLVIAGDYKPGFLPDVYGRVFSDMVDSGVFPVVHADRNTEPWDKTEENKKKDTKAPIIGSGLAWRLSGKVKEEYTDD